MWYFRWKHDLKEELDAGSKVAQTQKGPIEYAIEGESGPVIAGMHGGPGGYDQMLSFFSDLLGKGFQFLSWSRPGYLRTPLSMGKTIPEQADALTALLDALKIDKVACLGGSAGGPFSLEFAIRHPDRIWALIMECAVSQKYMINPEKKSEQIFAKLMFNDPAMWLYDLMAQRATKSTIKSMIQMESTLDKKQIEELLSHIMKDKRKVKIVLDLIKSMCPISLRKAGLDNDLIQLAAIERIAVEKISAPTLIIHGTNDADVPLAHAKFCADNIPNAELFLVEGGLHLLPLADNADEITKKIISFLKQHAPN